MPSGLSAHVVACICLAAIAFLTASPANAERRPRAEYEPPGADVYTAANLFRNATVTASGHWSDRVPDFAVDGSHDDSGRHWAAENLPVWLTVDLGTEHSLNTIRLWTYWGDGRTYRYSIEGSRDGRTWQMLVDRRGTASPASAAGETFTFPATTLRYTRATFTGNTAGATAGGHIVEIEAYNVDDAAMKAQVDRARSWDSPAPAGLQGAVGTLDVRYARNTAPIGLSSREWHGVAWRGERVNAQFVLWSPTAVKQLRLEASPLRSETGKGAITVKPQFLRYVLADEALMADIIDDAPRIDMSARSTRPVWVTVDVPPDAAPGIYTGTVTARGEGGETVPFSLRLEVLPLRLPPPPQWAFHLDLWQNPFAVARYHHVSLWSPEHFALLRPHLQMLADAGAKCLTASILHDPWGGQTFDAYGSMVEWIKKSDGTWAYDYAVFDRYVEFAATCGLNRYINCYSMIPWTNRLRYLDEATGDYESVSIDPKGAEYERFWGPFLKDFTAHLKRKGWLSRAVIAMDERPLELMRPAISVLRKYGPGLRLALAGDNEPKVEKDIDDWCVIINSAIGEEVVQQRSGRKALTTFYVCTGPERPNTFTYSPPAEAAWMGLYASARNLSGFLRWAYDSWTEDPLWDTKHVTWQSGDAFLIYPNARSSFRFERLREGIQQYEKIRLLRKWTAGRSLPEFKALDDVLAGFTYENVVKRPAAEDVNRATAAIERLSRRVADDASRTGD